MIFIVEELAVEVVVAVIFRATLGFVCGLLSGPERMRRPARGADRAVVPPGRARKPQRR